MNCFQKQHAPQVGSYVVPDGWGSGELLQKCDDWDQADFRLKTIGGDLAVNAKVTGRTLQRPYGKWFGTYVRVAVTFVADKGCDWYTGEMVGEDVTVRAWMKV